MGRLLRFNCYNATYFVSYKVTKTFTSKNKYQLLYGSNHKRFNLIVWVVPVGLKVTTGSLTQRFCIDWDY